MNIDEWLTTDLGRDIWRKKYQFENENFEEWLDRVSGGNQNIRQLIKDKKFLFGGRILANRGLQNKGRKITLSNCYVITPPEDNIESIFDCAKKLARTYSYGGGCGIDISKLSPRGSKLNNAARETTGSVSFMDLYSLVTELISQKGRRGALMISIDCSHPDIEEFINLKSDLDKVTKANISIKITDDFMKAVKNNEDWILLYTRVETNEKIEKKVKAKELFRKLAYMNWDYAEPGMLNWDRINNWNLLSEDDNFSYAGVNPCAEEPLPAGGSCLLGSINLSEFVINPFTDFAVVDLDEFSKTVEIAVEGLNEVLHEGLPLHPLQEQRDSVNDWRQIGLGLFGLHDTFIKMGIRYGSKESLEFVNKIGFTMINTAIKYSALLTTRYGSYPKYNKEAILKSKFFTKNTDDFTKKIVEEKGLANSQLLTIPPTGSTATMLGVSTALEPIYNISYTRKTESLHGKDEYYKVFTPIVDEYMKLNNIEKEEDLPDFINSAMTLDYKERIEMQSTWQKYIDASISSTVNVPQSFTIEEVEDLYLYAWEKELKGVTIFRDGCKRLGILTNDKEIKEEEDFPRGCIEEVPEGLNYRKYSLSTGCGKLYFFLGVDEYDEKIYDCFCNTDGVSGCNINTQAVSRLLSAGLRGGISIEYLIKQLDKAGVCPSYQYQRGKGKKLSNGKSCASAIANVIKNVLKEFGDNDKEIKEVKKKAKNPCPDCGNELRFEGGCQSCSSCGWSKCS